MSKNLQQTLKLSPIFINTSMNSLHKAAFNRFSGSQDVARHFEHSVYLCNINIVVSIVKSNYIFKNSILLIVRKTIYFFVVKVID